MTRRAAGWFRSRADTTPTTSRFFEFGTAMADDDDDEAHAAIESGAGRCSSIALDANEDVAGFEKIVVSVVSVTSPVFDMVVVIVLAPPAAAAAAAANDDAGDAEDPLAD